jgi:hypothetical protein
VWYYLRDKTLVELAHFWKQQYPQRLPNGTFTYKQVNFLQGKELFFDQEYQRWWLHRSHDGRKTWVPDNYFEDPFRQGLPRNALPVDLYDEWIRDNPEPPRVSTSLSNTQLSPLVGVTPITTPAKTTASLPVASGSGKGQLSIPEESSEEEEEENEEEESSEQIEYANAEQVENPTEELPQGSPIEEDPPPDDEPSPEEPYQPPPLPPVPNPPQGPPQGPPPPPPPGSVYKSGYSNRKKTATGPEPIPVATGPLVAVAGVNAWLRLRFHYF